MTIVYCDYTNGDDGTGDGSAGNPYKTITKASTGLTGGDEVRVAKSPADTALTGTLGFTINSTAVVGVGTIFTSELVIGDFVKGGDEQYYEIVTITDDTHAVLFKKYPSSTGAGVAGYKLGITSTGEAASTSTAVQTVSASGTSVVSRLKISGGWNLGTEEQDGQTYFRQMHGTFNSRYGRGLYANSKDYIEIDHLHFLRYDNCIYMSSCDYWKLTSPNLLSAGDEAWYLTYCTNNEIITPVVNSSADKGIYLVYSPNSTITTPTCNSNGSYGIYLEKSSNNIANEYSGTGNGTGDVFVAPDKLYGDFPCLRCQHFSAAGTNKCFYEYGVTERDTADARSTQCLKYDPTSETYYISQSFFFKADSGVAQTLSAYVKDDVTFNGDIQAAIFFMGVKITGWTEWTPTADYVQKTIVAGSEDITEDGVLELRIKVRGTAGNVFVDDLGTA